MNRYTRIAQLVEAKLQEKTGWGRNEIMAALKDILTQVADEEIDELLEELVEARTNRTPEPPRPTISDGDQRLLDGLVKPRTKYTYR
jgi:hypothetical protein